MQPEEFWKEYVGSVSPREFLGGQAPGSVAELHARVAQHVNQIPALYGLTIRRTWKKTWTGFGYNRDQVANGILRHLETKSTEWESAPDMPLVGPKRVAAPEPQPEPATPVAESNPVPVMPETPAENPAQAPASDSGA